MNIINRVFPILLILILTHSQPIPTLTDNCLSVSSQGSCLQCVVGFYLEYFVCLPCAPLCTCSSQYNYCQTCAALQFQNYTINIEPFFKGQEGRCYFCDTFIDFCLSCNSTTFCTKCYGGYYVINETQINGDPIRTICSSTVCQDTCQVCDNEVDCSICKQGYYLDNTTLKCSTGKCSDNCIECLDSADCNLCDLGFFVDQNGKCENCTIDNCITCTNTSSCTLCGIGYFLYAPELCLSTNITNCIVYLGGAAQATGCQVCQLGYFVLNSACSKCIGCNYCSLQFLCQSKCYQNTTAFNYACLESFGRLHVGQPWTHSSIWTLVLLLYLWVSS